MKQPHTNTITITLSIFYLMSHFALSGEKHLIIAINKYLTSLEQHPDTHSAIVKMTCKRLRGHWLSLLEKNVSEVRLDSEVLAENAKLRNLH